MSNINSLAEDVRTRLKELEYSLKKLHDFADMSKRGELNIKVLELKLYDLYSEISAIAVVSSKLLLELVAEVGKLKEEIERLKMR